jgi:hypothetical protein
MTFNVTPEEYRCIQDARLASVDLNGRFCEAEFQRWMWTRFGIWAGHYEVVVRYDVPSIPWLTKGVNRFGLDTKPWGVSLEPER